MSKYKRKHGVGGPTVEAEVATEIAALGQLQDQMLDMGYGLGNDYLSNKVGADKAAIINSNQNSSISKIPGIGNQIALGLDTINAVTGKTRGRINDFNKLKRAESNAFNTAGYANDANVTFANGGSLNEFNGLTHEDGGIELTGNDEVEHNETMFNNDYIFSDRLKPKGSKKTFAELSKKIKSRYTDKRPNDSISKKAEERELTKLQASQEKVRAELIDNAYQKAYGGPKSKRGFLEEKEFRREFDKYAEATGNSDNPYDIEHYYDYSKMFDETGGIMPHLSNDNHLPSEYKELGHPNLYIKGVNTKQMGNGGSIHINPENKGKFNATKARTGKTTEELTHSSNPLTRKRAIFAQNADKWKHAYGGDTDIMDIIESSYLPTQQLNQLPNEVPLNIKGDIQPLSSQIYNPLTDNREPQVYNPNYNPKKDIMSGDFTADKNRRLFNNKNISNEYNYVPGITVSNQTDSPYPNVIPELNTHSDVEKFVNTDPITGKTKKQNENTNSNLGGADAFDYASIASQLGSTIFDLYQNRKIDPVHYNRFAPKTVNMDKARINADKAINNNVNAAAYGVKQNAPNGASYLASRRALGLKGAELAGTTAADISQKEELANTDIYNKAGKINTNISNREIEDYAKNKGQVLENRSTAVSNLATGVAGAGSTMKKYRLQKYIASQLGTNDFTINPDGTITYKKNGVETTTKIG